MSTVTKFYDISSFQTGMNLSGIPVIRVKATQGAEIPSRRYLNPDFPRVRDYMNQHGGLLNVYHWIEPASTTGLDAEAEYAISVIGKGVATCIDAEQSGLSVEQILEFEHHYSGLGGRLTDVYLPHWFVEQMGNPDISPLFYAGIHLNSSNYPAAGYTDNGPGWAAYGTPGHLITPDIWQYTSHPLDTNAFRGTLDQLRQLWYPAPPTISTVPYPGHTIMLNSWDHNNVRLVQSALNRHGAHLTVDGLFGSLTFNAVVLFQRSVIKIVKWADGVVGPLTWGALGVSK